MGTTKNAGASRYRPRSSRRDSAGTAKAGTLPWFDGYGPARQPTMVTAGAVEAARRAAPPAEPAWSGDEPGLEGRMTARATMTSRGGAAPG